MPVCGAREPPGVCACRSRCEHACIPLSHACTTNLRMKRLSTSTSTRTPAVYYAACNTIGSIYIMPCCKFALSGSLCDRPMIHSHTRRSCPSTRMTHETSLELVGRTMSDGDLSSSSESVRLNIPKSGTVHQSHAICKYGNQIRPVSTYSYGRRAHTKHKCITMHHTSTCVRTQQFAIDLN